MASTNGNTARITVDLPRDDYERLKVAAAFEGRGESMSSLVRRLVHTYLDSDEDLQDAYDLALVRVRRTDARPPLSDDEVRAQLAGRRAEDK